jgi:hypothetical protein
MVDTIMHHWSAVCEAAGPAESNAVICQLGTKERDSLSGVTETISESKSDDDAKHLSISIREVVKL